MIHCSECRHWEFPRFPEDKIEEWDVRTCWLFSDKNNSPFEIDWEGSKAIDNLTIGTAPDFFCVHGTERKEYALNPDTCTCTPLSDMCPVCLADNKERYGNSIPFGGE